jgi:serine protease
MATRGPGAAGFMLALPVLSLGLSASSTTFGVDSAARVLVKLRARTPLVMAADRAGGSRNVARAVALSSRVGLRLEAGASVSELAQVVFASGVTSAELAARLSREPDVEYAVPDERRRIVAAPRDPLYAEGVPGNGPAAGQWYLRAPAGEVSSSLNVEPAWDVTLGRPEIVVAVVDTGVVYEHPDLLPVSLGGRLLPGYDMISQSEIANDGDGRDPDASDPGDWVSQADLFSRGSVLFRCTTSPESSSWHGTQVSGLVAALTDNGIGMAGTAPGVRVLPVRVLGKCGGYDSDIITGLRWAAGLAVPDTPANPYPARVINLSLGGDGACSAAYQEAVDEVVALGALIVAAAGNSAGHAVASPANCTGVLAVGGLRHAGTKVGYSSLGGEVAISAPAGNCVNGESGSACLYPILTTTDSGTTVSAGGTYTDSYTTSLGTSFSTPLVAGVAALVFSARPDMTPQRVRELLQATARPFPPVGSVVSSSTVPECTQPQYDLRGRAVDQLECCCTTTTCGAGMLDAGAALAATADDLEGAGRESPR